MNTTSTACTPEDVGWRLRQDRPGRWYALDLRSGLTVSLPETLSLLTAIGHFTRFLHGQGAPLRAAA